MKIAELRVVLGVGQKVVIKEKANDSLIYNVTFEGEIDDIPNSKSNREINHICTTENRTDTMLIYIYN